MGAPGGPCAALGATLLEGATWWLVLVDGLLDACKAFGSNLVVRGGQQEGFTLYAIRLMHRTKYSLHSVFYTNCHLIRIVLQQALQAWILLFGHWCLFWQCFAPRGAFTWPLQLCHLVRVLYPQLSFDEPRSVSSL